MTAITAPRRMPIEVSVQLKAGDDSFVGLSSNIGPGGLFVATDRSFSVGDRFTVRFTLPEQRLSISSVAEVRWVQQGNIGPQGVGAQLVHPSPLVIAAIAEFLQEVDRDLSERRGREP